MSEIKNVSEVSETMRDAESIKTSENLERELQQKGLSPEQVQEKVAQLKASVGGELNKSAPVVREGVTFTGTYGYHMGQVEVHGKKSRALERQANDLETDVRRHKEPESRMSEVKKLRQEAAEEKQQEQKHKNLAQQSLNSHQHPSFEGLGNCGRRCDKLNMVSVNLAK